MNKTTIFNYFTALNPVKISYLCASCSCIVGVLFRTDFCQKRKFELILSILLIVFLFFVWARRKVVAWHLFAWFANGLAFPLELDLAFFPHHIITIACTDIDVVIVQYWHWHWHWHGQVDLRAWR